MNRKVLLGLGALYILWGSTYLAVRYALESFPPLAMSSARFATAGALLYWLTRSPKETVPLRYWLSASLVGFLLLVSGAGLIAWSEQIIPSGKAALLCASVPAWMALWEWARPGGQRPSPGVLTGLALGSLGVGLLVVNPSLGAAQDGAQLSDAGGSALLSSLLILLASLSWSAGSLLSRSLPQPANSFRFSSMTMLTGSLFLALASWLSGEHWTGKAEPLSLLAWLYLVGPGSLAGLSLYTWLLRSAPPTLVSTYTYVNPLVAVALAWAVGETLPALLPVAGALVVLGVVFLSLAQRPRLART